MQPENQHSIFSDSPRANLPNATAVLVLGIVSIVGCFCYGIIGFICSIIALIIAHKDTAIYRMNPGYYFPASYANLRAGKICAIIGLVFSCIFLLFIVMFFLIGGMEMLQHPDDFFKNLK